MGKYICKRPINDFINNLTIGKEYKLLDCTLDDTLIIIDDGGRYIFFSEYLSDSEQYIWDYFFTKLELRKIKLKSIEIK